MKAQTFQYLTEWTTLFHNNMADLMEQGLARQDNDRAKWLLEYVIDHERKLAEEVEGFKQQADPKALNTWLYDQISETLPPDQRTREIDYGKMTFDQICEEIFDVHNQVMEIWKGMTSKGAIPEAKELAQKIYDLEKHETLRLADQITSSRDM